MQSKITGGQTTLLFTTKVLGKYDVKYYRCNDTGFIQTEEPYWLPEAYSSAITKLDIGLPQRNIQLATELEGILLRNFDAKARFLDYAGGYGLFTRLMRDKGFDFYSTDKFCQNIFADFFDLMALPSDTPFEAVTAFEVFEHLANPMDDVKDIIQYADNIIFTTELQPATINGPKDWWYIAPETGQHIALYTEAALQYMAKALGYNFYTSGGYLHLFTKKQFAGNPLLKPRDSFLLRKAKKYIAKQELAGKLPGRLMDDFNYIKSKLSS